jgi:regulator of replication initiation timing
VTAFSKDIADGEAYLRLIKAIAPEEVSFDLEAALAEPKESRAERIVKLANELQCLPIIKPEDILAGQPRLNLAFAATLFNKHCGIHLPTEDELRRLYEEIAGLKKTVCSLEEELEVTNRYKVTDIKVLEDERNGLRERLEVTEALHQAQVAEIEQEFTNFKIELAAQYRESIDSALTTERRARDEETGGLKASISDMRRKLLKSISMFVDDIGPDQLKGTQLEITYSNISDETSNADLIQIQTLLFQTLLEQRSLLQLSNESLKEELAHKENIEAIMAEKIRKYSEDRISESNVRGSRRSSLTTFKEKTIPAIGRFFTCQGR